jgi:hypothetical protein
MNARRLPLAVALACGGALLAWAVADPRSALQGWLIAAMAFIGIPLGSLVLLLVHALTGGRWGDALRPVLTAAVGLLGLAALALLPIALRPAAVFSWAGASGGGTYLDTAGLLIRTAIALAGWGVLCAVALRSLSAPVAATGLVFSAVAMSTFAVDWMLSVAPGYPSSAFPATFAVEKLLTALAFCALMLPQGTAERDGADLAGLLITAVLGLVYLELMTYIVAWYGNLPEKAAWFLRRSAGGWPLVLGAAGLIGAFVPLLALFSAGVRRSRAALRLIGGLVLAGVLLHTVWLVAPEFGWRPAVVSLLATCGLGALTLALIPGRSRLGSPAHA